jgi:epoxyqueuosine reductase
VPEDSLRLCDSASKDGLTSVAVKTRARELGFELCGVAPVEAFPELGFFKQWIAKGYAGTMGYLPRSAERRADVRHVMPSARSVIVVGALYNTGEPYSIERHDPARGEVARYAWSRDYHEVLGKRLDALLAWMSAQHPEPFDARAYVDTGPVQERVYAQYAGIGWIGKNTCVINPDLGSWLLLGTIVCSLPLEADSPSLDQCGTCTLCLEACPTSAIVAPGVLDSTRCISYLTIEHRGDLPPALHQSIGSHVYGCDICQEVCPWNMTAPQSTDRAWQPRAEWDSVELATLATRDDAELAAAMRGSAMQRAKTQGLRRNIQIALSNSRG